MAKLSSMRFKNYTWPHNPRVYEIEYRKDVVSHRVPFGVYTLQNMGRQHRVLRGEGEFAGAGAYAEFKKIATVFYETTPGVLVHPLWDTANAYFVGLKLRQEPTENYVAYSFEFWESYDGYTAVITPEIPVTAYGSDAAAGSTVSPAADEQEYYTAVYGDYLWKIARDNGLDLTELLALNPQIRNPNLLMVGDVIRVR